MPGDSGQEPYFLLYINLWHVEADADAHLGCPSENQDLCANGTADLQDEWMGLKRREARWVAQWVPGCEGWRWKV